MQHQAQDRCDGTLKRSDGSELLLRELIHRTANDFAIASALLHRATHGNPEFQLNDALALAIEQLEALGSIQRLLQRSPAPVIDLADALCELCHYHAIARFAPQQAFVQLRCDEVVIESRRGWLILIIVSELLTNAAKHAFQEPGGLVTVTLEDRMHGLVCAVQDNGVGQSMASCRGSGGAIIDALATQAAVHVSRQSTPTGYAVRLFELA